MARLRRLFMQLLPRACAWTRCTAGNSRPKMATTMAATQTASARVRPRRRDAPSMEFLHRLDGSVGLMMDTITARVSRCKQRSREDSIEAWWAGGEDVHCF